MRAKNICRSGILSVVDFTAEEKRARTCTHLQHPCTRLLIMEFPRLAIRDQIDNRPVVVPNRRLSRSGLGLSLRACHRATGDERYRCNSKLGTDHGILSCHRVRQRRTEAHQAYFEEKLEQTRSGLSSSPFRNSGYNNDQPAVATSSRRRRKLGSQRFSKRA